MPEGGESAGRRRLDAWLDDGLARYVELADDLAADATSRLSPYLHFGCVSAGEVVARALEREGAEPFVRQLCWRDFNHQLLAARPELARDDLRPRSAAWRDDDEGFEAWREGRTGYPLVDAGMRQLMAEGFMHNRARLVAGSFLTKHLGIDWRRGAEHFFEQLVDGDVANNTANWQWVAGTGTDTRPNRRLSPSRQAERFDPDGAYVRRYLPDSARPTTRSRWRSPHDGVGDDRAPPRLGRLRVAPARARAGARRRGVRVRRPHARRHLLAGGRPLHPRRRPGQLDGRRGQAEAARRRDAPHVGPPSYRSTAGSSAAGTQSRAGCSPSAPAAPSRSRSARRVTSRS